MAAGASAELGSLLIRLGFNANTVRDGLNAINSMLTNTGNRAQQTGNQLNSAGVRGAAGFSALTRAAVGFTAVVTAGLAVRSFVKSVAEANRDMENLSTKLGMPASQISGAGNAAQLAGGTKEGLEATLAMLEFEKQKYSLTGDSGLLGFFNYLQISLNENISALEMFLKMREKLMERTGGDKSKAWAMAKMMGVDEGTISLMLRSDKEFKSLMAQGKSTAMTDAESKSAQRISQSFTSLEQNFESLSRVLMVDLEPTIISFNEKLKSVLNWIENTIEKKGLGGLAKEGVVKLSSALNPIAPIKDLIMEDYNKWKSGSGSTGIWDTFNDIMSRDFFRGTWDEFLNQNRGKSPSEIGGDFLDRFITPNYELGPTNNSQSSINSTSTSTSIGEIKIYTQTQDQAGEIADKLSYLLASQSNTALS